MDKQFYKSYNFKFIVMSTASVAIGMGALYWLHRELQAEKMALWVKCSETCALNEPVYSVGDTCACDRTKIHVEVNGRSK